MMVPWMRDAIGKGCKVGRLGRQIRQHAAAQKQHAAAQQSSMLLHSITSLQRQTSRNLVQTKTRKSRNLLWKFGNF
jgi:hypothetical protein